MTHGAHGLRDGILNKFINTFVPISRIIIRENETRTSSGGLCPPDAGHNTNKNEVTPVNMNPLTQRVRALAERVCIHG